MTAQVTPLLSYSTGQEPDTLTTIYDDHVNIAIWQRELDHTLQKAAADVLQHSRSLQVACTVSVDNCIDTLFHALGETDSAKILSEDIHFLTDMYCCLFDLKQIGLRITKLDSAMCPKFHVDRVPARLITTYQGVATEWLKNQTVDRTKLGIASVGIPDDQSGVYRQASDVQQVSTGDVILLKGESWIGNEGNGIVHRSPSVPHGEQRLVMTLDFSTEE